MAPLGSDRLFDRTFGWPDIEVSETDKEVKVTAELPGLEEKDVGVELANSVLVIKGEKRAETEDKDRLFSERYYGRFERRIPVDDIEADNVDASFKSGVLTVTLPKSARAQEKVKRIAINGKQGTRAGATPLPPRLSIRRRRCCRRPRTGMLDGTVWCSSRCADPVGVSR